MAARQGLRIQITRMVESYPCQAHAHKRAAELSEAHVVFSMEFYDVPGECDEQRANRLERELAAAKRENRRLRAAAKPKAKKPTKKRKR